MNLLETAGLLALSYYVLMAILGIVGFTVHYEGIPIKKKWQLVMALGLSFPLILIYYAAMAPFVWIHSLILWIKEGKN